MALLANIQFGDNYAGRYSGQYLVTDCQLSFERHHNQFSPDGEARCERIVVTVVAPGKEDLSLYEWYISQGVQSGRIMFELSLPGDVSNLQRREVFFENAQCFALSENYVINSNNRRLLKLSLYAEKVTVSNISFPQL